MRMTITADDFGWSPDTVAATIGALEAGAVTNASLMPAAPAFEEAAAFARANPRHCYGVHLTLAGAGPERPVSDPASIPSLVGSDGAFRDVRAVRWRALGGRLSRGEIEREIDAQIRAVVDRGIAVDYVDAHKHLHKMPVVRAALAAVLPRHGIRRLRGVQDLWLRPPVGNLTFWVGRVMKPRPPKGLVSTDRFYMPTTAGETVWARDLLRRVRPGRTLEVGVHPGTAEDWRRAEDREVRAVAAEAPDWGIAIVPWRDIA